MFKPGMVCIFCDGCLDRKGNKMEYKETRREKQENTENMNKNEGKKERRKRIEEKRQNQGT